MSPYLLLMIVLVVAAVGTFHSRNTKAIFFALLFVMILMLVLRYGQGTDWFSYRHLYNNAPDTINPKSLYYDGRYFHGEIGWKILCTLGRILHIKYYVFAGVIGLITIAFTTRFIVKHCGYSCVSLMVMYPTIYMTYMYSIIRQALVIAIFLGVAVDLLYKRRYLYYTILLLLLSTIHQMAIVALAIPILIRYNIRNTLFYVIISTVIGMICVFVIPRVMGAIGSYYSQRDFSLLAVLIRCINVIIVIMIWESYNKKHNADGTIVELLYKIYIIGYCIYVVLMGNSLLASRTAVLLTSVEVALIPMMLQDVTVDMSLVYVVLLSIIVIVMSVKNIGTYIQDGSYFNDSIIEYPYVSVFDKDSIYEVRDVQSELRIPD